jgi:hypothetical protein
MNSLVYKTNEMIKMYVLCLLLNVGFTLQDNYSDYDFIQVASNFFQQRNVQTITAATCWSTGNQVIYNNTRRL